MKYILKSWANTFRFIIVLLILLLIINRVISSLSNNTKFDISYDTDKTLVTFIDKKNLAASSVLPACDCWINTGIEIRPGEEYEIKVSGKIHTVGDKLINDAERDTIPRFPWVDATGAKFENRLDIKFIRSDSLRKNILLNPDANIGSVLFYFKTEKMPEPNCDLNKGRLFIPQQVTVYESKGLKDINNTKEKIYLWAAVNDMLLRNFSETSKIAYLGGAQDIKKADKERNWEKLKDKKYNRLWFDDNFGQYIISAKLERPVPLFGFWSFN
jgi:hypothetical protein